MSAQIATAGVPVVPPVHIDGEPPPFGSFKMRAITGEPYSLTAKTTIATKFTDGTWHTTQYEERRMRDSEGRERSELLDASGRPISVRLTDPVAQTIINLQPLIRSATVTRILLPSPEQQARAEKFRAQAAAYRAQHPPSRDDENRLPPLTIAGVRTEGKRNFNVLGATMSDGQKVRVVEETWSSPDLGIVLAQTSDDPRGEKLSMKVTDLKQAEPASTLFQVPPDYKLIEQK